MKSLDIDPSPFLVDGGQWTAQEIAHQPAVWEEAMVLAADSGIAAWIALALADPRTRVVFSGAGTSAYIGDSLVPVVSRRWARTVQAVPTTDLVAAPRFVFPADVPTLLVSFARSGNSPESVAAVDLADALLPQCRHLVITCNPDGALAAAASARANARLLVLPGRTNDRAFAMTSSFTTMLLVAARLFGVIESAPSQAGVDAIRRGALVARDLVDEGFERIVYLGGNGLRGLAREASLKMLELTDGQVIATHETPLGFRHGPKTIVNDATLVVMFISNDALVRAYDLDLLRELRADGRARRVFAIGGQAADVGAGVDLVIAGLEAADEFVTIAPFVAIAQLLALRRSASLQLTPDQPCRSGTVNRVVRGVVIHPLAVGS
ncbi:MAG: SIS domain-containing protein [Burkholderiaceae bacterium]